MTITEVTPTLNVFAEVSHDEVFGLVIALLLLGLLITKDIVTGLSDGDRARWDKAINVAVAPLAVTFLVVATSRVIDVLS